MAALHLRNPFQQLFNWRSFPQYMLPICGLEPASFQVEIHPAPQAGSAGCSHHLQWVCTPCVPVPLKARESSLQPGDVGCGDFYHSGKQTTAQGNTKSYTLAFTLLRTVLILYLLGQTEKQAFPSNSVSTPSPVLLSVSTDSAPRRDFPGALGLAGLRKGKEGRCLPVNWQDLQHGDFGKEHYNPALTAGLWRGCFSVSGCWVAQFHFQVPDVITYRPISPRVNNRLGSHNLPVCSFPYKD